MKGIVGVCICWLFLFACGKRDVVVPDAEGKMSFRLNGERLNLEVFAAYTMPDSLGVRQFAVFGHHTEHKSSENRTEYLVSLDYERIGATSEYKFSQMQVSIDEFEGLAKKSYQYTTRTKPIDIVNPIDEGQEWIDYKSLVNEGANVKGSFQGHLLNSDYLFFQSPFIEGDSAIVIDDGFIEAKVNQFL
ncbi:hypothetical protein LAG90_09995 [Marinilongibacter aquaticus]|uniref:hypothetical protein n=1 Tax=Marinilongibacter aquaticus TaxID=2975157 RepID=UPI0021BD2A28|nr:hypothetical protein [Marinilongibacter aquaticus]UBM60961.1 hypothetical protein LAG90_09995 [Marinilongibacter aquaticus]